MQVNPSDGTSAMDAEAKADQSPPTGALAAAEIARKNLGELLEAGKLLNLQVGFLST